MSKIIRKSMAMACTYLLSSFFIFTSNVLAENVDPSPATSTPGESANGEKTTINGFSYIKNSDGTIKITKYDGEDTELVIPSQIDGAKVTSIGSDAISNMYSIGVIEIPESITNIEPEAFNISDIYYLGKNPSLSIIEVDSNNKYYSSENGILYNKDKSKLVQCPQNKKGNLTVPESVKSIEQGAFINSKLEKVILPEGIITIGNKAFLNATNLEEINIPSTVETIGERAFLRCSSMTNIKIPKNTNSIGRCAFISCSKLQNISIDSENKQYSSDEYGILYNKDKTKLITYPAGSKNTEIILPDSVETISESAFSICLSLTSIKLSKSLKTIESSAFANCSHLSNVEIQNGLQSIGDCVFIRCLDLKKIAIPDSVLYIGHQVFDEDDISIFASSNSYAGQYAQNWIDNNLPKETSTSTANKHEDMATSTANEYKIYYSNRDASTGDAFSMGSAMLVISSLAGMVAVAKKKRQK